MRHDCRQPTVLLQYRQHVLNKHEIGLFTFLGHHHGKATRELKVLFYVVLAKWRIGQNPVEPPQLVVFPEMLRLANGVLLANIGVRNPMQQHVHLADRPRCPDLFLAEESNLIRIATVFP